jgi:hypothetical protein
MLRSWVDLEVVRNAGLGELGLQDGGSLREPQPGGVPGPPGCSRGAMADVVADYEATNGSRSSIWHTAVATAASIAAPMASSGSVGAMTTALRVPARSLSAKLL